MATVRLPDARPIAITADSLPCSTAYLPDEGVGFDLDAIGYVEEEFYVSGLANTYEEDPGRQLGAVSDDPDALPVVAVADVPYTTRILLRRPAEAARFSGVVILESFHVGLENIVVWPGVIDYVTAEGHAWGGGT